MPERQLDWNAVVIGKGAAVPAKTILRGAANTVLTQTAVNDEPAFTKVALATMVTGVVPPANGGTGSAQVLLSYGATIGVPDSAAGTWFTVGVTNAAAHAFPAHINGVSGRMLTLSVINVSGGAIATATFHATWRQGGYVAPGNGLFTSATFMSNGTNAYQVTPWTPGITL
jgi:hypothetical protein